MIGQHTNNIDIVESEFCRYDYMSKEELYQPFIYLYDTYDAGGNVLRVLHI
jgi:hypothetical protein